MTPKKLHLTGERYFRCGTPNAISLTFDDFVKSGAPKCQKCANYVVGVLHARSPEGQREERERKRRMQREHTEQRRLTRDPRWTTAREIGRFAGLRIDEMHAMAQSGELPSRTVGPLVFFPRNAVRAWVAKAYDYLDANEVAARISRTLQQVRAMARAGKLPKPLDDEDPRFKGYWRKADIEQWLIKHQGADR
jgi:hypothetical protein